MKIAYDSQVDIMYIELTEAKIEESDEVADGIVFDYDINGRTVGIEILDASRLVGAIPERVELSVAMGSREK